MCNMILRRKSLRKRSSKIAAIKQKNIKSSRRSSTVHKASKIDILQNSTKKQNTRTTHNTVNQTGSKSVKLPLMRKKNQIDSTSSALQIDDLLCIPTANIVDFSSNKGLKEKTSLKTVLYRNESKKNYISRPREQCIPSTKKMSLSQNARGTFKNSRRKKQITQKSNALESVTRTSPRTATMKKVNYYEKSNVKSKSIKETTKSQLEFRKNINLKAPETISNESFMGKTLVRVSPRLSEKAKKASLTQLILKPNQKNSSLPLNQASPRLSEKARRSLSAQTNSKLLEINSTRTLPRVSKKFLTQHSDKTKPCATFKKTRKDINFSPGAYFDRVSQCTLTFSPRVTRSSSGFVKPTNIAKRHTDPILRISNTSENASRINKAASVGYSKNLKILSNEALEKTQYSYHLNNIPVDDITMASFSTPSTFRKTFHSLIKRNKSTVTSTPVQNRKTSTQQRKKSSKSLTSTSGSKKSLPRKGTLKRKRLAMKSLIERNDGYEDDIFENNNFEEFKAFSFEEDSDSSAYDIATPKCAFFVTPNLPKKTPRFKDCYSPLELLRARKVAEEYIYRRNKKRKSDVTQAETSRVSSENKNSETVSAGESGNIPEKKKLDYTAIIGTMIELQKKLEMEKESDEDEYFSDISS